MMDTKSQLRGKNWKTKVRNTATVLETGGLKNARRQTAFIRKRGARGKKSEAGERKKKEINPAGGLEKPCQREELRPKAQRTARHEKRADQRHELLRCERRRQNKLELAIENTKKKTETTRGCHPQKKKTPGSTLPGHFLRERKAKKEKREIALTLMNEGGINRHKGCNGTWAGGMGIRRGGGQGTSR